MDNSDKNDRVLLSPEEEAFLLQAIAEADAEDFVDVEQVLRDLREQRWKKSETD